MAATALAVGERRSVEVESSSSPRKGEAILSRSSVHTLATLALLACSLSIPTQAKADMIVVPNFSFEQGKANWIFDDSNLPPFGGEDTAAFGTTQFPRANPGDPLPGTADGFTAAYISIPLNQAGSGSITSDLGLATAQQDTLYTLTVAIGERADVVANAVEIDILLDGLTVASATTSGASLVSGSFIDLSTSFLAASTGGELTIRLGYSRTGLESNSESQGIFDNVRLDGTRAVPEPASLVMMGTGCVGLLVYARRRKAKSSAKLA